MGLTINGPRQFGQANDIEFAWTGCNGGLNINSAPEQLEDNELTQALNVYLRFDGGAEMRRGMTAGANLSTNPGSGLFRFWQQVVGGVVQNPVKTITLAQVGGNLYNADTAAQIGVNGVLGANALPWSILRMYDGQDAGGTDVAVICTGSGGPYRFDGTNVTTPAGWSAAAGARWCALLNNVLWFGGIPSQPNLLVGSLIGQPETEPAYQEIACSQPIEGLATIGFGGAALLVAGHRHGLSLLSGVNPVNFVLQEVPFDDGPVAGRTMVVDHDLLYWLGNEAVYTFDGANIVDISKKVQPWILNDPYATEFPMNGDRSLSWSFIYNNRLHLFYDSGNVGYPNTALVYDLVVQGWTVLSGPKLQGFCLRNAPGDPTPYTPLAIDATVGQVYNWDAFSGSGVNGHAVDDNGTPFQTIISSKYFKLGQPGTPKKLRRLYYELLCEGIAANVGAISDYGNQVTFNLISASGTSGSTWDHAIWDQSSFSSADFLTYVQQRVDFNLAGEAFSFNLNSSISQPPWRFMGVSGVFVQGARR